MLKCVNDLQRRWNSCCVVSRRCRSVVVVIDIVGDGDGVLERMLYPPRLTTSTHNSIVTASDDTVITLEHLFQKPQTDMDPLFIQASAHGMDFMFQIFQVSLASFTGEACRFAIAFEAFDASIGRGVGRIIMGC